MEKELNQKESKQIDVLLVEDSEDDILVIQRIFKNLKILNTLHIVRNGEESLDFIYHMGKYKESKLPAPGLILLDISMPVMSGFDVLEKLKSDSQSRKIPVIMLTGSSREEDIVKSYEYGACSYITKPADINNFVTVMQLFEIYWTLISKVPSGDR